uniref:ELYS beta-propeller domain-containing protein n=1 Tax=Phlebotomus papatasi TaxID=29031 RepID=A0A1B0DF59_PHLPP
MASAPFVRKPIQEFLLKPESKMVYPKVIDGSHKRKMDRNSPENTVEEGQQKKYRYDEHSRHLTTFPQKNKLGTASVGVSGFVVEKITGISRNGRICWIAYGANIEVMSVVTGAKVSCYNFQHTLRSLTLSITCVAEINVPDVNTTVLAIGFETSAFDGVLCLFSVQGSRPIQLISIDDGIVSCTEIQVSHLNNILSRFDGCLAVGTVSGKIVLVNVNLLLFRSSLFANQNILCHVEPSPCTIVPAEISPEASERIFEQTIREKVFFGVEIFSVQDSSAIVSILDLQEIMMLAAGCLDGSLILYNLQKLEAIHRAYPPKKDCPLMKLASIEPADDPRGHVYLWAMHSWRNLPIAVMHSITIEEKVDENNCAVYKYFKSSRPCLTILNYSEQLYPLDSQTFIRQLTPEDPLTSICMLSWGSVDRSGRILVFDLNQWYKDQMPEYLEWQEKANFLAIFPLTRESLRNVWLDENSVTAFNSIQRPEEHFYPNSLTFDCVCVSDIGTYRYHWSGLQNRAIENFMAFGPKAILEPDKCFNEMLEAVLLPQFTEFNHTASSSITAKRDLLLSIALEYNCVGILRECAKVWADGSHLGRQPFEGLSLSTLTEWMWQRVGAIRECCDHLCECLFDLSGRRLDAHSTKTLAHCTRQLRLLAELLEMIINFCIDYIPHDIQENLTEQLKSMQVSADYQEVLQWLHNMQLLPEGPWISSPKSPRTTSQNTLPLMPYPYPILKTFYDKQRMDFHSLTRKGKFHSGECSCSLLYIDTFIEKECCGSVLRSKWRKSGGNGLYPPATLHAMTSIFHLSDIPVENKYALFMYFLMDLDMAMKNDEKYIEIIRNVIKFPAVFKMSTSLIKTTQAFWKLDHGDFEGALEDLISPLGQDKHLSQWQMELLIECLLVQNNLCLALRALQSPGPPISPLLEMRCLLANKLVCEAFQLQKSRGDPSLLREFFRMCWELKLIGQILNLALTEADGEVLGEFLQNIDSTFARNLQFSYLLQRSKYMEALSLVAELQKRQSVQGNVDMETPGLVMEAYNSTMTPSVRNLSQMFFKQHSKFQHKSQDPVPLSSNLIKQRRSLEGSIYQKSAAAVEDATLSWLFQAKTTKTAFQFFRVQGPNIFFRLRKFQMLISIYSPTNRLINFRMFDLIISIFMKIPHWFPDFLFRRWIFRNLHFRSFGNLLLRKPYAKPSAIPDYHTSVGMLDPSQFIEPTYQRKTAGHDYYQHYQAPQHEGLPTNPFSFITVVKMKEVLYLLIILVTINANLANSDVTRDSD